VLGSIIIGVGPNSSQFTDKFLGEIASGPKNNGIIAVGVYTGSQGGKLRGAIQKKAKQLRAMDISINPSISQDATDNMLNDLVELQLKVVRLEPESILLIIDAAVMSNPDYAEVFHLLRATLQQPGKMSALCFMDDPKDPGEGKGALENLKAFTAVSPTTNNYPILDAVFIARTFDSPLANAVGGTNPQMDFLAKSMAQIWQANLYANFNPTFDTQVNLARQAGHPFIGMAVGSIGLATEQKQGFFARFFKSQLDEYQIQSSLIQLTEDLLQNQPEPRTTVQELTLENLAKEQSITVNIIAPLRISDNRFHAVRDGIQKTLRGRHYNIAHTSMIPGNGVPLKVSQQLRGVSGASANPPNGAPQRGYSQSASSQRGYAYNDYPQRESPMGSVSAGSSGYPSTDAPTIVPQQPQQPQQPMGGYPTAPGSAGAPPTNAGQRNQTPQQNQQNQKPKKDKFLGQVCILFGIGPEQI
jgi:hypothetical protein